MLFSDWIREQMNSRGWSQKVLADRSNLSRSIVQSVLSNRKKPGMKFFLGLATAFEMPFKEVVIIFENAKQQSENPENLPQ